MSELQYRTEGERVADAAAGNPDRPITSGDPFQMHTETQRVADAAYAAQQPAAAPVNAAGLLVHPETGHLVGIEQAPAAQPLALAATVADATDRRRVITAEEAANRIRGDFEPIALTEGERVADAAAGNPDRPITSGDPFQMHTETQRVADAAYAAQQPAAAPVNAAGLLVHPETGHLVGIEQAPAAQPLALAATVADATDRRRVITAEEAANRIRGDFEPIALDPEKAHHGRFLSAVAGYLGAEPNPANLDQIAELLGKVEVQLPDHEYPKMLYSRTLPAPELGYESHLSLRHDYVGVIVNSEEDAKKLGSGWIENPADLPKRDRGEVGQFEPATKAKPLNSDPNAFHVDDKTEHRTEAQIAAGVPREPYRPHGPDEPKLQADARPRPAGWDSETSAVWRDDKIDRDATNKERVLRGIPPLA